MRWSSGTCAARKRRVRRRTGSATRFDATRAGGAVARHAPSPRATLPRPPRTCAARARARPPPSMQRQSTASTGGSGHTCDREAVIERHTRSTGKHKDATHVPNPLRVYRQRDLVPLPRGHALQDQRRRVVQARRREEGRVQSDPAQLLLGPGQERDGGQGRLLGDDEPPGVASTRTR